MEVLADFVIVKKDKGQTEKIAGLEMTEAQDKNKRPVTGEVVGVGSSIHNPENALKVGAKVKYDKSAGIKDEIDGEEVYILRCGQMKSDIYYIL